MNPRIYFKAASKQKKAADALAGWSYWLDYSMAFAYRPNCMHSSGRMQKFMTHSLFGSWHTKYNDLKISQNQKSSFSHRKKVVELARCMQVANYQAFCDCHRFCPCIRLNCNGRALPKSTEKSSRRRVGIGIAHRLKDIL